MEFEKKTVNVGELLAEYIGSLNYGDTIHAQTIEEVTKERYGTQRYYNTITKAKKILESKGKAIMNISKGTYQVLYPGDYSGAYCREIRLARKHVKHGSKILKGAPVNDMSTEERKTFNDVADFHYRMEAQMSGCYVEVKRLSDKRHPLMLEK